MTSTSFVDELVDSGRFRDALAALQERFGRSGGSQFDTELVRAELLEKTGSISEAGQALAGLTARKTKSKLQAGRTASLAGAVQLHYGQRTSALVSYRRAASLLREAGHDQLYWNAQLRVMAIRGTLAEPGEAGVDRTTERGLLATGVATLAAAYHLVCSEVLAQEGLTNESAAHLAHAESIVQPFDNPWLSGLVHLNKGCHRFLNGDLDAALESAQSALKHATISGHYLTSCAAVVNIGATYLALGQVQRARRVLRAACEMTRAGTTLQALAVETLAESYLATRRLSECRDLLREAGRHIENSSLQLSAWHADWSLATRARLRLLLEPGEARVGQELPSQTARTAKSSVVNQRLRLLDVSVLKARDLPQATLRLVQLSLSTPLSSAGIVGQYFVGCATIGEAEAGRRGRLLRLGLLVLWRSGEMTDFVDCVSDYATYIRRTNGVSHSGQWDTRRLRRAIRVTIALDTATEIGAAQGEYCSIHDLTRLAQFREQHPEIVGEVALRYLVGRHRIVRGGLVRETPDVATSTPIVAHRSCAIAPGKDGASVETTVTMEKHDRERFGLRVWSTDSLDAADELQSVAFALGAPVLKHAPANGQSASPPFTQVVSASRALFASPSMVALLSMARRMAASEGSVLITGESGTGKDVIARYVHESSRRSTRDLVAFNCSTMPRDMIDSQLFGHRRGAFTGATEAFEGVLGAANGGTLFLDEISDLPLDVQPKLLRFLDTGEILRLGEARPTRVDVRILAATNADLEESVAAGRFRRDLYYRLNVLRIHVPPLRERPEDLEVILASFIDKYKDRMSKPKLEFSDAALSLLSMYDWPGNVRQLDGEICRIVTVYDDGCVVQPTDLSREIVQRQTRRRVASAQGSSTAGSRESLADGRRFAERELVEAVLAEENGNMAAAARRLGVSRKGLYLIRSRLGL